MAKTAVVVRRDEERHLDELEAVIASGGRAFVEVGCALRAIEAGGLYREKGYESFAAYCLGRWGWKLNYAKKTIGAADVVGLLEGSYRGTNIPTNERQARPLTKLREDHRKGDLDERLIVKAWSEAVSTAPKNADGEPIITEKHVAEVVKRYLPEPETPPLPPGQYRVLYAGRLRPQDGPGGDDGPEAGLPGDDGTGAQGCGRAGVEIEQAR